jgi:uncharacterized Zn-finger protein
MADKIVPHFVNQAGVHVIEIGVREFMCMGARPPFDHPHIFIDMGEENEAVCGYCATLFRYRPDLHADETVPPDQLYVETAPAAA